MKLFRESIGWGQDEFSKRLGLSLNQLAGIEYARVPLRYEIAWKIRELFGLSLTWLVNGKYPPNEPDLDPWPNPTSLKNNRHLLSEVERTLWFSDPNNPAVKEAEKLWWKKRRDKKVQKTNRAVLLSILKDNLQEWMAMVPEDMVDDFTTELMHCGQTYTEKYQDQPSVKVGLRTRALIWGEMREEINKRMPLNTAKEISEDMLDNVPPLPHTADVQNEIRDLKGLIERLKKVTAPRGAKAALAREFKVSRQAVNQWLSGESNPSADLAIRLQYWKPKLPAK